jgi:hypothetical protein
MKRDDFPKLSTEEEDGVSEQSALKQRCLTHLVRPCGDVPSPEAY